MPSVTNPTHLGVLLETQCFLGRLTSNTQHFDGGELFSSSLLSNVIQGNYLLYKDLFFR